jgi:peptide/nickel transport system substrate-binding protein
MDNYWSRSRVSRRGVLRAGGVAGIGLAGAALIGCGDDDDATTPGTTPAAGDTTPDGTPATGAGDPRPGGTLYMTSTQAQSNFNPVINWAEGNYLSGVQVYDRLISPRPDERVYVLEAAESIEIPDDTTVVFHLKEGLVYQDKPPVDGRPVTADDIVAMQYYARDEAGAENRAFQQHSMEAVEAPDDRTVVFHLQRPNAYLFSGTQLGLAANNSIIPRELVDGDLNLTEPVGSGPYALADYQFGVRYEYHRNPTYRDADRGLPYIDTRVRTVLTDASALEAAFRSEQKMVWGSQEPAAPPEVADRIVRDLGDRLSVDEYLALRPFTWNMSSARDHFSDIRVREAFYRAFNPDQYIALVADGWAEPAPGQLAAGLTAYQLDASETAEYKRHDLDEARALLDAAGFDTGQEYELTTIVGAENESAIQVMAEQLRQAGLNNLTFKILPVSEWLPNVTNTGNYDFCIVGHPSYDTPQTPIRLNHTESGNVNAWMNIRDPEIDAMIEASEVMLDPDDNITAVKEIQRELLQRYAHLSYVYTGITRQLRWGYVRDWEVNPATHPMYHAAAWLDI